MNRDELTAITIIALFGYAVFHGHRWGQDCWMCQYRGLFMMGGSVAFGWATT